MVCKNIKLEKDLNSLQNEHENVVEDCKTAYQKIRTLDLETHYSVKNEDDKSIQQELLEKDDLVTKLSFEIKQLEKENKSTQNKLDDNTIEIQLL